MLRNDSKQTKDKFRYPIHSYSRDHVMKEWRSRNNTDSLFYKLLVWFVYSLTNIPAHMSAYLGHVFLAHQTRVSAVLPIWENSVPTRGKDNKRADPGLETSDLFFTVTPSWYVAPLRIQKLLAVIFEYKMGLIILSKKARKKSIIYAGMG